MTEFTKEELEELTYCVAYAHSHEHELAIKIQAMLNDFQEQKKSKPCDKCGDKYHPNGAICL